MAPRKKGAAAAVVAPPPAQAVPQAPVLDLLRLPVPAPTLEAEADAIVAIFSRMAAEFAERQDAATRRSFVTKYGTGSGVVLEIQVILDGPVDFDRTAPPEFAEAGGRTRRYRVVLGEGSVRETMCGGRSQVEILRNLAEKKRVALHAAAGAHDLADREVEKLSRAAGLDIKHLLDRADEARHDFQTVDRDLRSALVALDAMRPIRAEIERGPFGEGSLFAKTLAGILAERDSAAAPDRR